MQKPYTLWQRVFSDTPSFFKKIQVIGLSLAGLGTSLAQIPGLSSKFTTILISAGSAITVVAQFAVKQVEPTNTQDNAIK